MTHCNSASPISGGNAQSSTDLYDRRGNATSKAIKLTAAVKRATAANPVAAPARRAPDLLTWRSSGSIKTVRAAVKASDKTKPAESRGKGEVPRKKAAR